MSPLAALRPRLPWRWNVKPAIDKLASPDFRSSLDDLAKRIDAQAWLVEQHERQIEAEHRED